jgi:hypothetical protein
MECFDWQPHQTYYQIGAQFLKRGTIFLKKGGGRERLAG